MPLIDPGSDTYTAECACETRTLTPREHRGENCLCLLRNQRLRGRPEFLIGINEVSASP